jgi:metallophosphoesterase (TIGR00282 family)
LNILFVGDIVGRPGRRGLKAVLPQLRADLAADLVIANGENAAAGRGLTEGTAQELFQAGVDVVTSGNHIWDQKEAYALLDGDVPLLRPLNYPPGVPGRGLLRQGGVTIINLQGRTFMPDLDCPFRAADEALASLPAGSVVLVDMHGEATSEKVAMGWYLDGRVTAVLGTHTHVPTADARILPGGTAVVTDIGMVGPGESVIGNEVEAVIERFLRQLPSRLPVAEASRTIQFNSVLVEVDEGSGRARRILRVDRELQSDAQ